MIIKVLVMQKLEILNGLICGDTSPESAEFPRIPLWGFSVDVGYSANGDAEVQYTYSTHSLRSIEKEKKCSAKKI